MNKMTTPKTLNRLSLLTTMLAAILTCGHVFTSCSNNDDDPVSPDPISDRTYQLDQKITNRRECHALKMIASDVLNLKFRQIVFEYTSLGSDMKTPVRLTGVISMNPDIYNKVATPRGLMLYNEFTCAKHGERTSQNEIDDIGLYMNKYQDIIMVSADLYGWTLTEDKPQAYCCPEKTKYYIMHSAGDKYMDWHVGEEMANYLKGHGCTVETEFGDWGNHVDYGLFQHIGKTMLLMEDYMEGTEDVKLHIQMDIIDKIKDYIDDKIEELSDISL